MDAVRPESGPAAKESKQQEAEFERELEKIAPEQNLLTEREPLTDVIEAYKAFDTRHPGWIKVELKPSGQTAAGA